MVEIHYIGFNQDHTCFAVGTSNGFRVYGCDPFREMFRREFNNGGIGLVEMLFRCNLLAIVGGGATPKYPNNKVNIWDDHQERCIGELSLKSQVKAVRLRRDRIAVALEHKVIIYNFADLKIFKIFETQPNPKGLLQMSSEPDSMTIACPGVHPGQVRLELYDQLQTKFISAHDAAIQCLQLSLDGTRLATCSEKGTLIRVWDTRTLQLLKEVRRGAEPARIYSLALSRGFEYLAATSDKGTVHVFAMPPAVSGAQEKSYGEEGQAQPGVMGMIKTVLPSYFSSTWSVAQFKLPADVCNHEHIVGFGHEQDTLYIVTKRGDYYIVEFDARMNGQGATCKQISQQRFINDSLSAGQSDIATQSVRTMDPAGQHAPGNPAIHTHNNNGNSIPLTHEQAQIRQNC